MLFFFIMHSNIKYSFQFEKTGNCQWYEYMKEGLSSLEAQSEHDFLRPDGDTDRLYMSIGDKDLIEVSHPEPQDAVDAR